MSGNTVIGRLSYASDKLMFADTVHSWYDPEDFEGFDGENMFIGEYYFADLVSNIESNKTYETGELLRRTATVPNMMR